MTKSPQTLNPRAPQTKSRESALSLLEVMVAMGILAIVGTALILLLTQNFRMGKTQSLRTQATTTALSCFEQIRLLEYPAINQIYVANTTGAFKLEIASPTSSTGYQSITLPMNTRDGVEVKTDWTNVNVTLDADSNAATLPMRFFITLKRKRETTGTIIDVFEIVLLYQWPAQGRSTDQWQTGNLRLVVPNLNPIS